MAESFTGGLLGAAGGAALGTLYVELTADSAKLVKGMAEAELSVKHGAGVMLQEIGTLSLEVTAGLALIGGVAVEEFAKFDKAMMRSLAVMEPVTAAMKKQMEDTARSIAKNSITPAEELAASYGTLAQAGLGVEASMEALGAVNQLARTGTISMTTATDILVQSQASLGLKVNDTVKNLENMVRVSDVLVKASTLTTASVQQLGEALQGKTGAALRTANKSVEEGAAVLAVLARTGIKAGEAGQALALVLKQLETAAIKNRDVFEKYEITVFDSNGAMRNMADIVGDVEKAFRGASAETLKAGLTTLGLQVSQRGGITTLLGFSEKIREYQAALESAGGTTKRVADDQMEAFHSQLQISTNRIKDLLITIGEGLEPSLKILNEMLQTLTNSNTAANESIKESANVYGTALVYAVKGVIMVFEGLRDLLKVVAIGILQLVEWTLQGCGKIAEGVALAFNGVVKGVVAGINMVITAINYWIDVLPDWVKEELNTGVIPELKTNIAFEFDKAQLDKDVAMLEDAKQTIWDSLVKTSTDAAKAVEPPMKEVAAVVDKMASSVVSATNNGVKGMATLAEEAKLAKEELDKLLAVFDKLGAPKSALQTLGLTDQKDLDALMKMGVQKSTIDELSRVKTPSIGRGGLDISGGSDPFATQSFGLVQEEKLARDRLKIWSEINGKELAAHKELQEAKLAAVKIYDQKIKQLQQAEALILVQAYQTAFTSIADVIKGFAGEQSTAYKAMFAVSKAFAIAESLIKIQQGIAGAIGAVPFYPVGAINLAAVMTAAANIISTIQSVSLAVGKAEGGPVTAGGSFLVGEKGPELFTPVVSGMITPNNRLSSTASSDMSSSSSGGAGQAVRVVINNFTDAKPEVTERSDGQGKIIEVVLKRVKSEISSEVREGRGDVSKAMEASYGLRRGKV